MPTKRAFYSACNPIFMSGNDDELEMWANAQPDGRPAKCR